MAVEGAAHQDGAFANPVIEYRRENLGSTLQRDIFFTLYVPLDLAGRRLGLRAAGRSAIARATADSIVLARAVEAGAARAFWRASLARGLLQLTAEQRDAFEAIAQYTETRLKEGAIAEQAAIRTRLEGDRARVAEGAAQAEWQRAQADLARAVGVSVAELPLVAPLDVLPAEARMAIRLAAGPSDALDRRIAEAVARRPETAALRAASRQASQRLGAERRSIFPEPTLQIGTKQTTGIGTRVIGLSMPIPILTQNGGARERARGEQLTAEAELRDAENTIAADVLGSYHALLALTASTTDSTRSHRPLEQSAADVAQIAEAAYREGGATLLELLEARRAAAEARALTLRWTADIHLALLDFTRAIGAPLLTDPETL